MESILPDDKRNTESVSTDADSILARKLQKVMIPAKLPSLEGIEIGAKFFSSIKGGGNLYDVIRISEDVIAFLLFDVAGEGMKPVLISAMAKICFANHVYHGTLPCAVIERVNGELYRYIGESLRLTAFVGYLDLHDLKFTYCNTGFTTASIFRRNSGVLEALGCHHADIGVEKDASFEDQYVYLQQGDCLVLFTEGLLGMFPVQDGISNVNLEFFLQDYLVNSTACGLLRRIEEQYIHVNSNSPVIGDVSIICAEVLTQSRKNQIKDRLGFKSDDKVYLQFITYLEEMDRTTATILSALDIAGYKDEDIRKMKIILTELIANAIIHGNRKDHSKKVVVGHLVDKNKAIVSILDEGSGFNPAIIPNPTLPENLEKPCGRGLFIVRHYVESIEFNDAGNRVTITKTKCPV